MMNRKMKIVTVCCMLSATLFASTAEALTVVIQNPSIIPVALRNVNAAGETGGVTVPATTTRVYLVANAGFTSFVVSANGTVRNRADVLRLFLWDANVALDVEALVNAFLGPFALALNQRLALNSVYIVYANTTGGDIYNDPAILSAAGVYTN